MLNRSAQGKNEVAVYAEAKWLRPELGGMFIGDVRPGTRTRISNAISKDIQMTYSE